MGVVQGMLGTKTPQVLLQGDLAWVALGEPSWVEPGTGLCPEAWREPALGKGMVWMVVLGILVQWDLGIEAVSKSQSPWRQSGTEAIRMALGGQEL